MPRDKIYAVRGVRVMPDFDPAASYGYQVSAFNQQGKRNVARFEGEDFMFRLSEDEFKLGQSSMEPHAFTEQGIYMLTTVLKGELATRQSRLLIRMLKYMKDTLAEARGALYAGDVLRLAIRIGKDAEEIRKMKQDKPECADLPVFMHHHSQRCRWPCLLAHSFRVDGDHRHHRTCRRAPLLRPGLHLQEVGDPSTPRRRGVIPAATLRSG